MVNYLFAAVDNGAIFKRPLTELITDSKGNDIASEGYSLKQNYPNPFNPSTIISYEVPQESRITIELFSIIGERVALLVNENQKAGYYNLSVNLSIYGLASGVYLYRINAVNNENGSLFNNTKKLLYLK